MQLHRDEIPTQVAADAHAIVVLDRAGWRTAKVSHDQERRFDAVVAQIAQLNTTENVWQYATMATIGHHQ
jgi:hypothetical protein